MDLERLGTALFFARERPELPLNDQAALIHEAKPHISVEEAAEALRAVGRLLREAEEAFGAPAI